MKSTEINVATEQKNVDKVREINITAELEPFDLSGRLLVPNSAAKVKLFCCSKASPDKGEAVIELTGTLNIDFDESCARCGKQFIMPFECDFLATFGKNGKNVRDGKNRENGSSEYDDTEAEYYPYSGEVIDLTDMLRDTIYLNLPLYNLCKEDCKGICHVCGQNLNEAQCEHADSQKKANVPENNETSNKLAELLSALYENNKEV